jgi:hypothetical protein
MRKPMSYPKATLSLLLAAIIATVFTVRSLAAPDSGAARADAEFAQDCTGTLTVASGQVTINGNPAQTGATVLTGSVIATGSNGKAIIDLGTMGRVELGDNTSITLTCVAGVIGIRSNCGRTEVEVRRGSLDVTSPVVESLAGGQEKTYDGAFAASSAPGIDVKIECEGRKGAGALYIGPGLLGLLAMAGVGTAVALGIAAGSNEAVTSTSPIR